MPVAEKILITGGTLAIAFSFVLGFWLSRVRLANPDTEHGWLLNAHRLAIQEGFMFLGLVFAVILSDLKESTETVAAWLLVASGVFQIASSLTNHVKKVDDQFRDRGLGYKLAVINSVLATLGIAILVVGVFGAL